MATGMVEGAIKHVIGKRCDHGEINGDWDAFIARVRDDNWRAGSELGERRRLQHNEPAALPTLTSSREKRAA